MDFLKKALLIGIGVAALVLLGFEASPFLIHLWRILSPEVKLALLAGFLTALGVIGFISGQYLYNQAKHKSVELTALIQGFGTAGDNILRVAKGLFWDRALNKEVKRNVKALVGRPIEQGELDRPRNSYPCWPGFSCRVMELAGGQVSLRAARGVRKAEKDFYLDIVQDICGPSRPNLLLGLAGNGVTGLTSLVEFPWWETPEAGARILWLISDREKTSEPDINTNVSEPNPTSVQSPKPRSEIQLEEKPLITVLGRMLAKETTLKKGLTLSEEKLECIREISHLANRSRTILVLSENLPERGYDNEMRKRAILTVGVAARGTKQAHGTLEEEYPTTGYSDAYHLPRYPGIYTHSELRMLSGLNGVMSLAQDLRSNNLAWHFGSFKQEIPLDQRQILIVFAIGSPGLVNGVVQAIGESAPGTTIIPVTHSHPKARSAYVVLFAPLFPSEIADSPFCTAAWVDLENFS